MNKRGQFYLVISLVIIASVVGLSTVYNLAQETSETKISHVEEELEIESEYVLDYHTNTEEEVLDNFTKEYSDYLGGDTNIIYILENESGDLEVFDYEDSEKNKRIYYNMSDIEKGKINVPVNSLNHSFELRDGKDFYFIITKESSGEKYVITNQD